MGTHSRSLLVALAFSVPVVFSCGAFLAEPRDIDDAGAGDGAPSGAEVGASSSGNGGAGCIPGGSVILSPEAVACPAGTTEKIGQADPKAQDGACTCSCQVTSQGSCNGNNVLWEWGGDATCEPSQEVQNFVPPTCYVKYGGPTNLAAYNRWPTITPSGVTCNESLAVHEDKVTSTSVRQCVVNAGACVGAYAGDRVCVPAEQGASCPEPYSVALTVGDSATAQCSPCTQCATNGAACIIEYHGNNTCTNKLFERPANGTCMATGPQGTWAFKLIAKGATCSTLPGTATASLVNAKSYCCTP
jgi:hypothetical protein